ncbi:MAG: hypothetical protein JW772_01470 [Candidatus Diapherotrites archaeon]|nr:hypothetical protein [Candidatus Diapherotrites archaeon]
MQAKNWWKIGIVLVPVSILSLYFVFYLEKVNTGANVLVLPLFLIGLFLFFLKKKVSFVILIGFNFFVIVLSVLGILLGRYTYSEWFVLELFFVILLNIASILVILKSEKLFFEVSPK